MSLRNVLVIALLALSTPLSAQETSAFRVEPRPAAPGTAIGVAADMLRTRGGVDLTDHSVGALISVRHPATVHQFAMGVATEAWALPGSLSVLAGLESAVVNEEPSNGYRKVAVNAVMKNRADGGPAPRMPQNTNSIAYWVTAQPGTGFERGLVFDRDSLAAVGKRPAVVDLSELPDAMIGEVDLIRIRKDVSLRYDPITRQLVLHIDYSNSPNSGL